MLPVLPTLALRKSFARCSRLSIPGGAWVKSPLGLFTTRQGPCSYKRSMSAAFPDNHSLPLADKQRAPPASLPREEAQANNEEAQANNVVTASLLTSSRGWLRWL